MFKIKPETVEVLLNYLANHKISGNSWTEINSLITQLTQLEKIEKEKKDKDKDNPIVKK